MKILQSLVFVLLLLFLISCTTQQTQPAVQSAPVQEATPPPTQPPVTPQPTPSQAPSQVQSPPASVTIENFAFSPETITIKPGTTITWTNQDVAAHTVKFADEQSGSLGQGSTFSKTFTAPGTYPYVCGIHSSMRGNVVVA